MPARTANRERRVGPHRDADAVRSCGFGETIDMHGS
jgi:hypothetical protein